MAIPKLTVTINPTADGTGAYMQIMSGDMFTVNIVLIAGEIEIKDTRKKGRKK